MSQGFGRVGAVCLATVLAVAAACSDGGSTGQFPDDPTVEGPVTGPGTPFVAGTLGLDLADAGFQQRELFISGTAASYTSTEELGSDGLWVVEPAESADYKTRILVYRPVDPAAFSGTVVVEWLNVSGGLDAAPDWSYLHTEIFREGHAWVGVSAQINGIEGAGGGFGLHLKQVNPERYGSLLHPGDSFSYEMFAQAAQAVRNPTDVAPLGELPVERVIAVGESQSAGRLVSYVNALGPLYDVFDGYIIHSRGGGAPALAQSPQDSVPTPPAVRVREDLDEPVLMFQAETDLVILNSVPSNQPDSEKFRLWEVAGTAHGDVYSLVTSNTDLGDDPSVARVVEVTETSGGVIQCDLPINAGPAHWVLKAGLHGLVDWIVDGTPLPMADRLSVTPEGDAFELDAHGNALGGIRTNYVDVPVAVLSGLRQSGESFCRLFGTTMLFHEAKLTELYPTETDYVEAVRTSTEAAVAAGFLLPPDAALIVADAEASGIGGP